MSTNFKALEGKVLINVEVNKSLDEIHFYCDDGCIFEQYHSFDCCESVVIEDICGDLNDLCGSPIIEAREESNSEDPPRMEDGLSYKPESYTWTFYVLRNSKASVTIRWYGESNGYYSETATFRQISGPMTVN